MKVLVSRHGRSLMRTLQPNHLALPSPPPPPPPLSLPNPPPGTTKPIFPLQTQIKSHGYGKLPQLKFVDGTILVDSDEITSLISAKMGVSRQVVLAPAHLPQYSPVGRCLQLDNQLGFICF